MNLTQYIEQTNPQRNPCVILDRSEITIGASIKINGVGKLTQVWITDGIARILWGIMYIKKENDLTLWTTDKDGNPKKRSCFSLSSENDVLSLLEIK
jgi:hypothetical protein